MATTVDKKDRAVIPRWRTFRMTAALGELSQNRTDNDTEQNQPDFLADKIADWQIHRTVWHASDLVGAALTLGRRDEAREAAGFVLGAESGASDVSRGIASAILAPFSVWDEVVPFCAEDDLANVYRAVHKLRLQLSEQPHNSILWTDLALAYTILGLSDKASRAVRVAVEQGPTNRFVLRSAARFYVHQGDPETAHNLLARAETTAHDPWLMSAEIAVASAGKLRPTFVKAAKAMLSSNDLPARDLTELAGSVGTVELENGNGGPARRFFKSALIAPNENSIAQVE